MMFSLRQSLPKATLCVFKETARRQASAMVAFSFASPESDFCSQRLPTKSFVSAGKASVWSNELSFASPELDFCSQSLPKRTFMSAVEKDWSGMISFASPEADFCSAIDATVKHKNSISLPRTLAEALLLKDKAVVVTTAAEPHSIVHVNRAWEELCGFTKDEVLGKTLRVIQGQESNRGLAEHMVEQVLETHKPHDAYLVNYTKLGERFVNHVSVGPMWIDMEESGLEPMLVGILEKVAPNRVPLRLVV